MWMKIDDRMHSHRKTRAVTKSHPDKRRDVAPMGLWVAAGSWSALNGTDGWVPEDELDRWEDDWVTLAQRLVDAGYWWHEERADEPGYGFNDWLDYNPSSGLATQTGEFGNHVRWHVNRGLVDPECEHCPKEPVSADSEPDEDPESGGDIGGRSVPDIGGRSGGESDRNRSTRPDPTRPDPDPSGARKRASQLPRGFQPNEGNIQLAISEGINLRREFAKFCDHHQAKGSTFKDWHKALNTWIRKAAEYGNVRPIQRPAQTDAQGQLILPPLPMDDRR